VAIARQACGAMRLRTDNHSQNGFLRSMRCWNIIGIVGITNVRKSGTDTNTQLEKVFASRLGFV